MSGIFSSLWRGRDRNPPPLSIDPSAQLPPYYDRKTYSPSLPRVTSLISDRSSPASPPNSDKVDDITAEAQLVESPIQGHFARQQTVELDNSDNAVPKSDFFSEFLSELGPSTSAHNEHELPSDVRVQALRDMENLRKEMHLRPDSQGRENHVACLAILYSDVKAFPSSPDIQEYEIQMKTSLSKKGGFGDCFKGVFLNKFDVAMKCLRIPTDFESSADQAQEAKMQKLIAREVHVWKKLNHNHILPLIGLCTLDSVTYMVSPWMTNGNACDYIKANPSADRLLLLAQVAEGLEYLHEFSPTVVHGDVRGPNILISATGEAKLADFGLSYEVSAISDFSYSTEWKNAGNWAWMAPELMKMESVPRTPSTDVFSFGRTIVELITGKPPFYLERTPAIFRMASDGDMPKRPEKNLVAHGLTDNMWALAEECCRQEPENRPKIHTVAVRIWAIRSILRTTGSYSVKFGMA